MSRPWCWSSANRRNGRHPGRCDEAKRLGARTLSIVNVVGSSIANDSDDVIYTWAGPEIAVATTKAYSTQLAVVTCWLFISLRNWELFLRRHIFHIEELSCFGENRKDTGKQRGHSVFGV